MAFDTSYALARETQLLVSRPFDNIRDVAKPAPVTITVATAAEEGDTTLAVEALPTEIKKGTVLYFGTATPVAVLVTEDAAEAATSLTVNRLRGDVDAGIPADIDALETAQWDGMYRVAGTETADITLSEGVTSYTSNTYDSAYNVVFDEKSVDTASWQISRAGRAKLSDFGYFCCFRAATAQLPVWVKLIRPGEDNKPAVTYQGAAWVTGFSDQGSSTAMNDASWTFDGNGRVEITTHGDVVL